MWTRGVVESLMFESNLAFNTRYDTCAMGAKQGARQAHHGLCLHGAPDLFDDIKTKDRIVFAASYVATRSDFWKSIATMD